MYLSGEIYEYLPHCNFVLVKHRLINPSDVYQRMLNDCQDDVATFQHQFELDRQIEKLLTLVETQVLYNYQEKIKKA